MKQGGEKKKKKTKQRTHETVTDNEKAFKSKIFVLGKKSEMERKAYYISINITIRIEYIIYDVPFNTINILSYLVKQK